MFLAKSVGAPLGTGEERDKRVGGGLAAPNLQRSPPPKFNWGRGSRWDERALVDARDLGSGEHFVSGFLELIAPYSGGRSCWEQGRAAGRIALTRPLGRELNIHLR